MYMMLANVAPDIARGDTNTEFAYGVVLFMIVGFLMAFVVLVVGKLVRPQVGHPEKDVTYECGEPTIGSSWVQFDLRFYTVALVFIVFDVEITLLWPVAVVFKQFGPAAFWAFFVFFLLIAIPFAYEWRSGYLEWVRSSAAQSGGATPDRPADELSAAARAAS